MCIHICAYMYIYGIPDTRFLSNVLLFHNLNLSKVPIVLTRKNNSSVSHPLTKPKVIRVFRIRMIEGLLKYLW